MAVCMRNPGGKRLDCGGWAYPLGERKDAPCCAPRPAPTPEPEEPAPDFLEFVADCDENTPLAIVDQLARELGLPVPEFRKMCYGWSKRHQAWVFPMRSPERQVIGVRLRSPDGHKWAVKGSRSGLFFHPPEFKGKPGLVLVCEGPTDACAAMALGFRAVGRPACRGSHEQLLEFFRLHGGTPVIVSDNDPLKTRPDGTTYRPGQDGSLALSEALPLRHKLIIPPAKDIREWLNTGATPVMVESLINNSPYRTGKAL